MTALTQRALHAVSRFHATHPWDHNAHHHRWILRQLPRRLGGALDVGCGSGDLVRLLAARAEEAWGIDADAEIVERARESTDPAAGVTFVVGDALTDLPPGPYDAVTCVAVIHHLPFAETLVHLRRHLAPGGTLVVVGVHQARTRGDRFIEAVAVPANLAMAWARNRGRRPARPVAMTAPTRPATMPFADVVREARAVLPGARLRRRLFWRYTLVWRDGSPGRPT